MASRVLSIVFTDIKGFTERTAHADRDFAVRLRAKHDELLKPIVASYGGVLVKTIGDAFLLTFESPTNAVLCALMMQDTLRHHNAQATGAEKIEIRVAINTGEVTIIDGDILGEPVNVASRVEGITDANEIWFTESTYLAMNKQEVPTSLVGEFRLKGVPEALKVYRVVQDTGSELFRQVVAQQQQRLQAAISAVATPPGAAPAAAGATAALPAGPTILAPAPRTPLSPVFIGVVAIALIIGLVVVLLPPNLEPHREAARTHLAAGRPAEAFASLDAALKLAADDPETRILVREAVRATVRRQCDKKEFGQARTGLDVLQKKYAFLGDDEPLLTELLLAEARHLCGEGQRDRAKEMVQAQLRQRPNDAALIEAAARFYHQTGIDWTSSVSLMFAAARAAPGHLATDPMFLAEVDWFLHHVGPHDGYDNERAFLVANFFDTLRPSLEQGLYVSGDDARAFRWNARAMLMARQVPVDQAKFHLVELLNPEFTLNSAPVRETLAFFMTENAAGSATQRTWLPARLDAFPLLDRDLLEPTDPAMVLAGGLFAQPLRDHLVRALTAVDHDFRRVNAFRLLAPAGLATATVARYHAANVAAWTDHRTNNDMQSRVLQSLTWLRDHGWPHDVGAEPPTRADLVESLRKTVTLLERNLGIARDARFIEGIKQAEEWLAVTQAAIARCGT